MIEPPFDTHRTAASGGMLKSKMLGPVLASVVTAEAERFLAYHQSSPAVYIEFCKLAERMRVERGLDKYSADVLFHVLRWHRDLDTTDDEYTINNDHNAYYARQYMWHYDCPGFFSQRKSKADILEWPQQHRGILRGRLPVL